MIAARQGPPTGAERFPLASVRERWLDFLALEHATLPLPIDFTREGDDLLVVRAPVTGRRIADGRIPIAQASSLWLQAAGLCAFLQAYGFWLAEEDLTEALYDSSQVGPRLWLARTPRSISVSGPGPAPSAVLAAFLHRLFARGPRIEHSGARSLFDRMLAVDAPWRRAEFWLAAALRTFQELALPEAAASRARTIGVTGLVLRGALERARLAKARALLEGRCVRVFAAGPSSLTPGSALGLEDPSLGVAAAARALRGAHDRTTGKRPLWVAVEMTRWDPLSRRAFETASSALASDIEVLRLEDAAATPRLPDEWRREIFVPCGTIPASLRFYDRFAELAEPDPSAALALAQALTGAPEWAAFVSDPTGDGAFPALRGSISTRPEVSDATPDRELLEALACVEGAVGLPSLSRLFPRRSVGSALARLESRADVAREGKAGWRLTQGARRRVTLLPARRRAICLRWALVEKDPGRQIELLIEGGDVAAALEAGERWLAEAGAEVPERWFGLSARLAAVAGPARPVWLERLEVEREIAGGRLDEARARLLALSGESGVSEAEKRSARLRALEILWRRGDQAAAALETARWRAEFLDAPAAERVRAMRIGAIHRARQGEQEGALHLLDEAERLGADGTLEEQLETALARANVYSLARRFREEQEVYERWRRAVLERGDDRLTARLLAHEALCLSDRRDFPAAITRLQEALAVTRDDAVERARLSIDLAATLYHAGRPAACGPLLQEALTLAVALGRGDMARVARCNAVELAISRTEWDEATRGIELIQAQAEAENNDAHRLVALHQRSRVALRRGLLEAAKSDNARARDLAARLNDRLEIGELWLEEGDRALWDGDLEGARSAWQKAAEDPPDRCDTELRASERLRDLAWRSQGAPPEDASVELAHELDLGQYEAAERVARWQTLFGTAGVDSAVAQQACRILRARGGSALADRVFGFGEPDSSFSGDSLRPLRDSIAAVLAGSEEAVPLAAVGLSGLAIRDESGREVLRLPSGFPESDRDGAAVRTLAAGSARYQLALWPAPSRARTDEIAFLLETLLYRAAPTPAPEEFALGWRRFHVITADAAMEEPYRRLVRFAPQRVTVLVLGESGSGKEAVARAVHQLSPRSSGPFVAVNVTAVAPTLLESELFGHARGAFTGADRDRRGLLEEASGGTIFFDEIGDLSLPLQSKLLRALQEREIRRVGENRARSIDVRVVSATSRLLDSEVERGAFREDLYYRLHVAVITLPPLRDRGRDAVLLARHFLERFGLEYARGSLQFSPEALALIAAHAWPGNVRELQNAVAQAAALAEPAGSVTAEMLPESLARTRRAAGPSEGYRSRVDAHRRVLIREALERTGGNRTHAARELGLSRQALLYLIRELNVPSRPRSGH